MNWRKAPRGDWVGHDGTHRYTISPIWVFEDGSKKPIRAWRMRIDGNQVGGADKTAIWMRVADAKMYAEEKAGLR